jgi:hypothetical protein
LLKNDYPRILAEPSMSYNTTLRAMEAAERRRQRDAQRRLRESERTAKENAKVSVIEQARSEVQAFDNHLEVLSTVHKEQGEVWDWMAIAASLPPPSPARYLRNEHRAKQCAAVLPAEQRQASANLIEQAQLQDQDEHQKAVQAYSQQMAEWEKLKSMARRILAGEHRAFTETLVEFNPFADMSEFGSSIHFTVHSAKLVECALKVNGKKAIPTEVKTLTSGGKVSVKAMPKGRFHEIYQGYLCGCVLRVGRELFALFPVSTVLVTAVVDSSDLITGQTQEQPVLSVAMLRVIVDQLAFGSLEPSEAIEKFHHRSNFKASRKSEAFTPIIALTPADIAHTPIAEMSFGQLFDNTQRLRAELKCKIDEYRRPTTDLGVQSNLSP